MIISNTSTLVLLAKINCLEQFIQVAPTIVIPEEVRREAIFPKDSFDARFISRLIEKKQIIVRGVEKSRLRPVMAEFRLHEGEAAAYVMFNPKKHKAILADDGELIKLCRLEQIPFMCAMSVVIVQYKKMKLEKAEAMEKLKALHEIGRYSENIYNHFKKEVI